MSELVGLFVPFSHIPDLRSILHHLTVRNTSRIKHGLQNYNAAGIDRILGLRDSRVLIANITSVSHLEQTGDNLPLVNLWLHRFKAGFPLRMVPGSKCGKSIYEGFSGLL
jgi:hypothetical protein